MAKTQTGSRRVYIKSNLKFSKTTIIKLTKTNSLVLGALAMKDGICVQTQSGGYTQLKVNALGES